MDEQKLLELYNDTLEKCGVYLLSEDDEVIAYNIYEEFDIGVHSFLYMDNLKKLYDQGLISLDKLNDSHMLRDLVIQLQNSGEWGIENFRTSKKWRKIMELSDRLRLMK